MTPKTYTIHGLPDLPEGYGPEIYWDVPPKDESMCLYQTSGLRWFPMKAKTSERYLHVRKSKPWYPAEWYDEDGNLLPDVYEHTPGEWPKHCKPSDTIQALHANERKIRRCHCLQLDAEGTAWANELVAYRIVERGDR